MVVNRGWIGPDRRRNDQRRRVKRKWTGRIANMYISDLCCVDQSCGCRAAGYQREGDVQAVECAKERDRSGEEAMKMR